MHSSTYIDEGKLNELKKDISALLDTPLLKGATVSPSQRANASTVSPTSQESSYAATNKSSKPSSSSSFKEQLE